MIQLEPAEVSPERVVWRWDAAEVSAEALGEDWVVRRSWAAAPLQIAGDVGPPTVTFGLGDAEALAHLDAAWLIAPGGRVERWVSWPLELRVHAKGLGVVDRWRRDARQAVLGPVDTGRVLPAFAVRAIQAAPLSEAWLRLRVVVRNHSDERCILRRFPVAEDELALFRVPDGLLAGTVHVSLREGGLAEAQAVPDVQRADGERIALGAPRRRKGFTLAWLLDATRRSTEFNLE